MAIRTKGNLDFVSKFQREPKLIGKIKLINNYKDPI